MATSGTVSTTNFTTRQVIDHAFRRCRLGAQQITSEMIDVANDQLYIYKLYGTHTLYLVLND